MASQHPERLMIACVKESGVRSALEQLACRCQWVASRERLLSADFHQPPSVFLLESHGGDVQKTVDCVVALRHQRPLSDIVIWAPRASGTAVGRYFRAGAKDVVAGQSIPNLVDCISRTLDEQRLLPRIDDLSRLRNKTARFESLLSRSETMWDLFNLCSHIAPSGATVLIVGETGTGKELLARAVHRRSQRLGRFVAANCASIPPDLINSELFGHEKGAFTGADRAKEGLVSHAHEGTLFLDEVGDMPPEGQQSLLRMLQERRVRPVGSLVETKVDVRVVAATNVPLDEAVRQGDFREDLFYRLDVIRMNVPPLRERPEDILFLFGHFVKRLSKHYGLDPPTYAESFLDALTEFSWPGNVRQLENFSERLVLAHPQRTLTSRDFAKLRNTGLAHRAEGERKRANRCLQYRIDPTKSLQQNVQPLIHELEGEYLRIAMERNSGRVADTAKHAGISRRTLLRKMKAHGIDKRTFKD